MHRPGRRPPPAQQWLERLREQAPEQYERLERLREESPREFRHQLRDLMMREHMRGQMQHEPRFRKMLENMPPEEREQLMQRLGRAAHRSQRMDAADPEVQSLEKAGRDLAQQWRKAGEEERPGLRDQLRENLAEQFRLREEKRSEDMQRLESRLQELKTELEERQANKDQIIDRRLQELLGEDTLAW